MAQKEKSKNIRVGIFVLIGTIFIISALYFIGEKQNLFSSKFRISANFTNVNGLMIGNNVRFGGINIGTVESVDIINDTTVYVVMAIKNKLKPIIKKNSLVSIGTDGLMGNKLINIISVSGPSPSVSEGDVLQVKVGFETEEMIRTISNTNDDVAIIAKNLKEITNRLNDDNNLWSILLDPMMAGNIKEAVVNIKLTSERSAIITGDLSRLIQDVKSGKGVIGALITDTSLTKKVKQTIVNIKFTSDTLAYITGDLKSVSQRIKNGEGAIGTILMDTNFVHNLNKSMENIEKGTDGFNQNMKALKHSILLRKYFKKETKSKE